jgi:hypothetical protein
MAHSIVNLSASVLECDADSEACVTRAVPVRAVLFFFFCFKPSLRLRSTTSFKVWSESGVREYYKQNSSILNLILD